MANMVFLGAGASKAFSYPTTLDFYPKSKAVVGNINLFQQFEEYVRTKGLINKVDVEVILWELEELEKALKNFEVMSSFKEWLFFQKEFLGSSGQHRTSMTEVSTIRNAINKLVYETYWGDSFDASNSAYMQLFKMLGESLDIFTTNYDLCVEHVFWDEPLLKEKFTDGFTFDRIDVFWNASEYEHHPNRLFKLHGSLNWKNAGNGKILRFNRKDIYDPQAHAMLYPGFKGTPEIEPYKTIHENLAKKLTTCEKCLVIGFSFRDDYINSVFKTSLAQNKNCKVLIWDPQKPKIPFEKMMEVKYFEKQFSPDQIPAAYTLLK